MTKAEQQEAVIAEMKFALRDIPIGCTQLDSVALVCARVLERVAKMEAQPVSEPVDRYGELKRRIRRDTPETSIDLHEIIDEVDALGEEPAAQFTEVAVGEFQLKSTPAIDGAMQRAAEQIAKAEAAHKATDGSKLKFGPAAAVDEICENCNQPRSEHKFTYPRKWYCKDLYKQFTPRKAEATPEMTMDQVVQAVINQEHTGRIQRAEQRLAQLERGREELGKLLIAICKMFDYFGIDFSEKLAAYEASGKGEGK